MGVVLNAEARARLDKHLDAVEAALVAAGNSREQRRGVLDDLEAQILDMLAARSQAPTIEDVEAVLDQLDPPTAYSSTVIKEGIPSISAPPQSRDGHSLPGTMSFIIFCTAGVGEMILLAFAMTGPLPSYGEALGWLGLVLCFLGVILGFVGVRQKKNKRMPGTLGLILNTLVVLVTMGWILSSSP